MSSDLISRQAALYLAEGGCHPANLADEIRKLPSAQPPTTDTISRQKAIDAMCRLHKEDILDYGADIPEGFNIDCRDRAVYELKQLPSVEPERKAGRWMVMETAYGDTVAKCNRCGFETLVNEPGNGLHMLDDLKFCPSCGAKLEGGDADG